MLIWISCNELHGITYKIEIDKSKKETARDINGMEKSFTKFQNCQ